MGDSEQNLFKKVIIGGTFDRLHKGHEKFLGVAFSTGEEVYIGIVSDMFFGTMKKPLSEIVQGYKKRLSLLKEYLKKIRKAGRAHIFPIDDQFGDTLTNEEYEAIVVTEETKENALKINRLREEKRLQPLVIIEVPLLPAEDEEPISSSRIRAGVIDTEGKITGRMEIKSKIRENIARILKERPAYGYELKKIYDKNHGKISLRLVYYHLAKGCEEGLFQVKEVRRQKSNYSWGQVAERVYYELGPRGVSWLKEQT